MVSINILESLRYLKKPVVAVMITSDNVEWLRGYREAERLDGKDPYSASKGMAELARIVKLTREMDLSKKTVYR